MIGEIALFLGGVVVGLKAARRKPKKLPLANIRIAVDVKCGTFSHNDGESLRVSIQDLLVAQGAHVVKLEEQDRQATFNALLLQSETDKPDYLGVELQFEVVGSDGVVLASASVHDRQLVRCLFLPFPIDYRAKALANVAVQRLISSDAWTKLRL